LHVDWVAPETARYDLCCAGRLVSKHTLIAEKAEDTTLILRASSTASKVVADGTTVKAAR
jgi:hypothetical protein